MCILCALCNGVISKLFHSVNFTSYTPLILYCVYTVQYLSDRSAFSCSVSLLLLLLAGCLYVIRVTSKPTQYPLSPCRPYLPGLTAIPRSCSQEAAAGGCSIRRRRLRKTIRVRNEFAAAVSRNFALGSARRRTFYDSMKFG